MKRSSSFDEEVSDQTMIEIGQLYDDDAFDIQGVQDGGGGGETGLFEFETNAIGRPQCFLNTLVKQRFRTTKTKPDKRVREII